MPVRKRAPVAGRWRCSLCGKGGKSPDAMAEFYFHWRSYHDTPTPLPAP